MLKSPNSQRIILQSQENISPRTGSSLVPISSTQLLLFGGASIEEGSSNGLFFLDLEALSCHSIRSISSKLPAPRYDHFAGISHKGMIVFGGANNEKCFSDTWLFDLDSYAWTELQTTGDTPTPRTSKEAAVISSTKMYVCGGGTQGHIPVPNMHVHELELRNMGWRCWETFAPPPPRLGHSTHWINESLLIYGGMAHMDFLNDVWVFNQPGWHQLQGNENGISGHASVTFQDTLWITGGLTPQQGISNRILTYSLKRRKCEERGTLPVERVDHCLIQRPHSTQLVMFGGMDHTGVYNDLYLINTEES